MMTCCVTYGRAKTQLNFLCWFFRGFRHRARCCLDFLAVSRKAGHFQDLRTISKLCLPTVIIICTIYCMPTQFKGTAWRTAHGLFDLILTMTQEVQLFSFFYKLGKWGFKVQGTFLEAPIKEVVELGSNTGLSDCKVHVRFKITSFKQHYSQENLKRQ